MSLWTDNVVFHGMFYIICGVIVCLLGICGMHLREIKEILKDKFQPERRGQHGRDDRGDHDQTIRRRTD